MTHTQLKSNSEEFYLKLNTNHSMVTHGHEIGNGN